MSPLPGAPSARCRGAGCNARLLYVTMASGKRMPVDAEPDPAGNVAVYRDGRGIWVGRVLTQDDPAPSPFERLMMPHMATCPALRKTGTAPVLPDNVIPLSRSREVPTGP